MKLRSASRSIAIVAALIASAAFAGPAQAALTATQKANAEKAGHDAFLYGYAPIYMNSSVSKFPANNLINVRYLATDQTRAVVKPNADTLYTIAVLDVGTEPIIVHLPATASRYVALELIDSYTNVFGYLPCINSSSSKTVTCPTKSVGSAAADYAIVGPKWSSSTTPLKASVKKIIKATTPKIWIVGRTFINGPSDLAAVQAIQDGITLQANSKVGTSTYMTCINSIQPGQSIAPGCFGLPLASTATPPPFPLPNADFFRDLGAITQLQPPPSRDSSLMTRLRAYGIGPGLNPSKTQSAEVMAALLRGAQAADTEIDAAVTTAKNASLAKNNGWILFDGVGQYGTNYLTRALIAKYGVGANHPSEAIYPAATSDYLGNTLNASGGAVYRIRFASGQLPPTNSGGFWSITLYAPDQFFIPNPISRFAVGKTTGLVANPDGTTDVYVSASQPSSAQLGTTNWLPAPSGEFTLMMRVYRPTTGVLNGTWKYPRIEKIS